MMEENLKDKKIAVLLSGGVDSSVVVYELVSRGLQPDCFYIKIGPEEKEEWDCSSEEDLEMATAVAHKYGCRLQGTTDVAFTVLDVLGYLDEIPVCVGYEINGEVTTDFPTTGKLEIAKPVLKTLPGWKTDIRGIKNYEELPENCRNYIEFVEEQIGYPITMVSNGPGRNDIIYRESKLSK